jgi:hypothetical protein
LAHLFNLSNVSSFRPPPCTESAEDPLKKGSSKLPSQAGVAISHKKLENLRDSELASFDRQAIQRVFVVANAAWLLLKQLTGSCQPAK